jgi:hypothetical protein
MRGDGGGGCGVKPRSTTVTCALGDHDFGDQTPFSTYDVETRAAEELSHIYLVYGTFSATHGEFVN